MINTDTFLKIGDSHKVCEDYIIKGNTPVPYIILSDGCSSSDNTEMGARILCHLAKQYLKYRSDELHNLDYHKMGAWIIYNAELTARQLGLKISCLDATLIISYELDGTIYLYMYGDGVIVLKDKNNNFIIDYVEFSNNAPYYLTYLVDEFRDEIYYKNKNSKKLNTIGYIEASKEFAYDAPIVFQYNTSNWSNIFICSDGIQSFIKKDPSQRDIISPLDIVPDMMAFKNIKGEFLKRRLKRALKKFDDDGIIHYDDLSIGAYNIQG